MARDPGHGSISPDSVTFLCSTCRAVYVHESSWAHHPSWKGTVSRTNRQPAEREEIFADHRSDKVLVSRKYKELLQFNTANNPIQRSATGWNAERKYTNGQEAHTKCLKFPIIREMQSKTTMRYHLASIRSVIT